jgi:hypothetical protein
MADLLAGEDLDAAIDAAARRWREPGDPSDWRNFEASEHPDQRAVTGEYMYLTEIANRREDYLHATSEATQLDAWDELRAAEQDLQRYRDDRDGVRAWERDAGRWRGAPAPEPWPDQEAL